MSRAQDYVDRYCRLIEDLWRGAAARDLLRTFAAGDDRERDGEPAVPAPTLSRAGTLWAWPMWWHPHASAEPDDARPRRVDWSDGALTVAAGSGAASTRAEWVIAASGSSGLVDSNDSGSPVVAGLITSLPQRLLTWDDPAVLLAGLAGLVDAGRSARVDLMGHADRILRDQVHRAHATIRTELTEVRGSDPGALLGHIDLQVIADRLVYESGGSMDRLLDHLLQPRCFDRVDPARFVAKWLARDAEGAIRVAIGDVRDNGRIVRRWSADHNISDPERIVAALRRERPRDHIGERTVRDSLALSSRVSVPLDDLGEAI